MSQSALLSFFIERCNLVQDFDPFANQNIQADSSVGERPVYTGIVGWFDSPSAYHCQNGDHKSVSRFCFRPNSNWAMGHLFEPASLRHSMWYARQLLIEFIYQQNQDLFIMQISGTTKHIDRFLSDAGDDNIIEIARSGVTAMEK